MNGAHELHDEFWKYLRKIGQVNWSANPVDYHLLKDACQEAILQGNLTTGGRILDLGCGSGTVTTWLSNQGFDAYGIDISPTAIDFARVNSRRTATKYFVGDAVELAEFSSEYFELIIDSRFLHCLIGTDRARCFSNARRVLKPSGLLLIVTMCQPVNAAKMEGYDHKSKTIVRQGIPIRYIGDQDKIVKEVKESGFKVLYKRNVQDPDGAAEIIILAQTITRKLENIPCSTY